MYQEDLCREIDEAISRVRGLDEIDGHKEMGLRTIRIALYTGLQMSNGEIDSAVFDALVMLDSLIKEFPELGNYSTTL